jgi:hypothetical protein
LGDLAEKHPVRILGWRPAGKNSLRTHGQYEAFTMQVEIEGVYDALGQFLAALENQYPAAEVRQVELTALNPAEPKRRLSFNVNFPILPPNQQTAPSSTPKPS